MWEGESPLPLALTLAGELAFLVKLHRELTAGISGCCPGSPSCGVPETKGKSRSETNPELADRRGGV